jgi:hypothetical protein
MSPAKPKLADPGALIRAGKLKTAEWRVCLDPDLVGEYEQLLIDRDKAKIAASDSLAGGAVAELDAQIAATLEAMEDATITLVLKALPRPEFRALIDKHPPRKDAEGNPSHTRDERIGLAYEPFFDDLLRVSIAEPAIAPHDLSTLLDDLLTDGQWDELTTVAWNLNRQTVSVPFSPAVSPTRRKSLRK